MSDLYTWLAESECDTLCHIEDELRSNEMNTIEPTTGYYFDGRAWVQVEIIGFSAHDDNIVFIRFNGKRIRTSIAKVSLKERK